MGDFKFACPVCGQHITADPTASGSQLECPTCYRKIVVPQAPTAAQKFVLSASEVGKPRPFHTPQSSVGIPQPVKSNVPALIIALAVLLIGGGATAFFVVQKKNPPPPNPQPEKIATIIKPGPEKTNAPVSVIEWKLDLSAAIIPGANVSGRIHGRDFNCERAILQGGQLSLRLGSSGTTELGIGIYLFAKAGEELSGQTVNINTNQQRAPRISLRWKDGAQARSQNFTNGYAMKLEFGSAANGRISGKIYLCAPDDDKSSIAGVFDAEIRKPVPPKPVRPKTPRKP